MEFLKRHLPWLAVALLGTWGLATLALSRGEAVSATWLVMAAICVYLIAYRYYSLFIADKVLGLDATRNTPAWRHNDGLDFVPTHKHTLQCLAHPDVFVLGDATNLPSSKAGSVAHFQSETLADNVLRHINGQPLKEEFDGHSNCFIESGNGKALLIDFSYDQEPHEGPFPFWFGPMKLLEESRLNHWGKHAFRWVYWNVLLRALPLPGISRTKKAPPA